MKPLVEGMSATVGQQEDESQVAVEHVMEGTPLDLGTAYPFVRH